MKQVPSKEEEIFLKEFWKNANTYRKLAEKPWTAISHSDILGAKNGTRNITITTALSIANNLDIPIDLLFQINNISLETAYKLVCADMGINKDDLIRLRDKKLLADNFILEWRKF